MKPLDKLKSRVGSQKSDGNNAEANASVNSKKSLSQRFSIFKSKSKSLLLIDWDGLSANAFVLEQKGGKWTVANKVSASGLKPKQLVAELVQSAQEKQLTLPKTACLVTQTVFSDVVELPIASPEKVADARIHDMLKWEVEPLLADYYSTWSLEKVLVGLGCLSSEKALAMSDEIKQARLRARSEGGDLPQPFGNACVEAGYFSQDQLTAAIELQEYWQLREASKFKLHFQMFDSSSSSNDDESDGVHFLFNALDTQVRNDWFLALQDVGCQLLDIHSPLSWLVDQLPKENLQYSSVDGVISLNHTTDGGLKFHRNSWEQGFDDSITMEMFLFGSAQNLPATHSKKTSDWLQNQLSKLLDHELGLDETLSMGPALLLALQNKKQKALLLKVSARDPLPPVYTRPLFYKVAIVLCGIVLVLGLEISSHYALSYAESETVRLHIDLEKKEAKNEIIEKANQKLSQKLEKVVEQGRLNVKFEREFTTLQEIVNDRRFANLELLDMFARSVPDDIYLKSIIEDGWHSYEVKGWGLSEESIREFASRLVSLSEDKNMQLLKSPSTRVAQGFNDLFGYQFEFRIFRKPQKSEKNISATSREVLKK